MENKENGNNPVPRKDNRTSDWLMFCHIAVVVLACVVVLKIVWLQFIWHPGEKWERIFGIPTRVVKETPERGDILTYDGKVLATSIPLYQIRMDCKVRKDYFKDLDDPDKNEKYALKRGARAEQAWRDSARVLSGQLSEVFPGQTAGEFYDLIIGNRDAERGGRDIRIGGVVDQPTMMRIKTFALFNQGKYKGGMKIDTLDTRQYPYGSLAYRAIGQVRNNAEIRNDNIGIEGKFNYALHGEDGTSHKIITDGQTFVQDDRRRNTPAVRGLDVRTTLNIEFCGIADRTLRRYMEAESDIMQGCVMIMDTKTGALRVMVNLRRDGNGNIGESWNSCIGEANHPGSVFKTVTMLMAMDDKGMTINSPVPAIPVITYRGKRLPPDVHLNKSIFPSGYATLEEGLMISSNNVFRQVAINHYGDAPQDFVAKLYEYKLMECFDFDIDGLARPTCKNPKDKMSEKNPTGWSPLDLPQMAFGYALRVTPLHVLTFYNAIANKGRMMKPYLVESLERDGVVVEKRGGEVLNASICKESTAGEIGKALLSVTTKLERDHVAGTGYWAFKDCKVKVAGKTGTAFLPFKQVIDGKTVYKEMGPNKERVINATFAGFFPYENPEYTAVVSFKTVPTTNKNLEGARCGRILKDIINEMYKYCPEWQTGLPKAGELPDLRAQNEER